MDQVRNGDPGGLAEVITLTNWDKETVPQSFIEAYYAGIENGDVDKLLASQTPGWDTEAFERELRENGEWRG